MNWQSGWEKCNPRLLSDDEIARRVRVSVDPIEGLAAMSPTGARQALLKKLAHVFEPQAREIELLRVMLDRWHQHLTEVYPSRVEYLKGRYSRESPLEFATATCVTGLAGTGKSAIVDALRRVFASIAPSFPLLEVGSGHAQAQVALPWVLKVGERSGLRELLKGAPELQSGVNEVHGDGGLVEWASRMAFRSCVGLLAVDELQFLNQGTANAAVTKLLLSLRLVCVPFFYFCNYSLGHRLMRRNSEDKQRLLADPILVLPEEPEDPAGEIILRKYHDAVPGGLFSDRGSLPIEQIWRYTFGVKRSRLHLVALGYELMRERKQSHLSPEILEDAFGDPRFQTYRAETQLLREHRIGGKLPKTRKDLECPFELPRSKTAAAADRVKEQQQEDIRKDALLAQLTEQQRSAALKVGAAAQASAKDGPKRKRPPATAEGMLAAWRNNKAG